MVIDTSALVAILLGEPEQIAFVEAIEAAASRRVSTATIVETSIVIASRRGSAGLYELDRFLANADIESVPVDQAQAAAAREAFLRFGKGRHRASLNLGDCFVYALAYVHGEPLLSKGDDFIHTDLTLAVRPEA
jgi:ribonuclease VapC